MARKKLIIREDISDWRDETLRKETVVSSPDEIRDALKDGHSTNEIARSAVVSRELGHAPADLLRANKLLIMAAAAEDVSRMARELREIEIGEKVYEVPGMVGKIGRSPDADDEDDSEPEASYVTVEDPAALDRALEYLAKVVPGHIWRRLTVVAAHNGDLEQAGAELKAAIDDMVSRLG